MLDRLTDWKPTILGALICVVIVAALVTRPEWGAADLATLAGGVAAAVLGAWARSGQAAEKPAAPTVPPLAVLVIACLAMVGCARPLDTAIRTVNASREAGVLAHDVIEAACLPAYKAATRDTFAAVDARCKPALDGYRVYTRAHVLAVVAVQRAELGIASEADALAAALALGKAGGDLANAVKAVAP